MKKIVILFILCLLLSGCSIKKTEELSSAEKFANEYSIDVNNPFEYINYEEIVELFDNGSGILFLGNSDCEWCIENAKILYEVILDSEIDLVYYFNPNSLSEKKYNNLIKIVDNKYSDDFDKINLPSLFVIKNGKVIGYSDYSLEDYDDYSDKKAILKNKYIKLINM
jgi:hypothetical protein